MSDSPVVVEMLSLVGYDHLVIDFEHSPSDLHSNNGISLLRAADASASNRRTECIVRLAGHDVVGMKKLLDIMKLPGGVLVPMVEDAATAREVVASTRYPKQLKRDSGNPKPQNNIDGIRGCAAPFVRATGWGMAVSMDEYMEQICNDLLVMVQVESAEGVESIEEIASVDGIDGIFLGPFDLSTSVGRMGQFEDEEVQQLIKNAEDKVLQSDCFLAGFRPPTMTLHGMFDRGYSLVCGSLDVGLLKAAAQQDIEAANEARN